MVATPKRQAVDRFLSAALSCRNQCIVPGRGEGAAPGRIAAQKAGLTFQVVEAGRPFVRQ